MELPSASTQFVEPANETSSLAFKGRTFRGKEQHSCGPETKQKKIKVFGQHYFEHLGEIDFIFETKLGLESGDHLVFLDEKNRGRKSHACVSLAEEIAWANEILKCKESKYQ